jgi:hypothetical protein
LKFALQKVLAVRQRGSYQVKHWRRDFVFLHLRAARRGARDFIANV